LHSADHDRTRFVTGRIYVSQSGRRETATRYLTDDGSDPVPGALAAWNRPAAFQQEAE